MGRPALNSKPSGMWRMVERQRGKPMATILPELFARLDGRETVANELGISPSALDAWIRVLGFELQVDQKTRLVSKEASPC